MFLNEYPEYGYVNTPKSEPADIDGFITRGNEIISGVEVKCRTMTHDDLMTKYGGRWLVTHDKVERGISLCQRLGVDFRGFLYLVPDDELMIVKIWDRHRGLVCDMDVEESKTQATVNGGSIVRLNAYIDMTWATVVYKRRR